MASKNSDNDNYLVLALALALGLLLAVGLVLALGLALALGLLLALGLGSLFVMGLDEFSEHILKGYIAGLCIGTLIGWIYILVVHPTVPVSIGAGINLEVPQNWGHPYPTGCASILETVTAANGASKLVNGSIACIINAENATGYSKTFTIANVPANSTISIHNFTNYTISVAGISKQENETTYYQGTVEAIYTNNPSYVEFTTGMRYIGNLSLISNLSVGAVCKLQQNGTITLSDEGWFINGTCEMR